MSGVNVLAVMDEMIDCYHSIEECPDDTLFLKDAREARAAVAELIEAAEGIEDNVDYHGPDEYEDCPTCKALGRLRAAIARVGGAK